MIKCLECCQWFVSSDLLLAGLFPFLILIFGFKFELFPSLHDIRVLLCLSKPSHATRTDHVSVQKAFYSYSHYLQLSYNELSRMRTSYFTLGRTHNRLGHRLGYTTKLDRLKEVIDVNAGVTRGIARLATTDFEEELRGKRESGIVSSNDLGRVRETLKHFVRDWSQEGKEEREKIFQPIFDVLREVGEDERGGMKVLVPGCGLGRLAWEVSQLGYDTTANELSYYMTLSFRFLLSPSTTITPNQHTLHPYAHWFSHQRTNESLFRAVTFPDVVPRLSSTLCLVEGDFLSLTCPSPISSAPVPDLHHKFWLDTTGLSTPQTYHAPLGYSYIITLFFLDTSLNAFATIQHIYTLLRPGGSWINLGPLLWTGGAQAKVELSLEEVFACVEDVGFVIEGDGDEGVKRRRTVECEYTCDRNAMMRWIYETEFWVARKSK